MTIKIPPFLNDKTLFDKNGNLKEDVPKEIVEEYNDYLEALTLYEQDDIL